MTREGCEREPIEELAEEFIARLRRGENPSLSEYADRHPDLAARIRDLFPTLVMMERFGDPENSSLGGLGEPGDLGEPGVQATNGTPERRLGEYRILREIGRGGMGVVYEAEQESLGRHVALKVLASHWRLDEKQLKRFQREARAVAKLQHPNIVPVYGIGEHQGVPYYVMQFIRGQGLDAVLQELRALTLARHGPALAEDSPPTLASQVARRLVQVGHAGLAVGAESIDLAHTDLHHYQSASGDGVREPSLATALANQATAKSTVAALAGQTEAVGRSSSSIYFQSVARMGDQIAEALAYAHEQGILHRDIKPSNLLVDGTGAVWITDFGLAKATTEDNLTDSGDMVGTLRYMAPEQLRGWADPRSDVYGLGITLYELLALRPAFLATDRALLIAQVLGENPPRLRKVCRNVPFDLETIVHKAMAKEPEQRYVSAGELAADLRRFLEGQPIKARRATLPKWLWLWSRRNPLVAALLAGMFLILPTALALTTYLWRDAEKARQAEAAGAEGERRARLAAEKAEQAARESEADTKAFSEFLVNDVLSVARPTGERGGLGIQVTVRQALEAAQESISTTFKDRPRAEATARHDLGVTFRLIGELQQAEPHLRRALALRQQVLGHDHEDTLQSQNSLGVLLRALGKHAEAVPLLEETLKLRTAKLGPDHPDTLGSMVNLALGYQDAEKLDLALPLYKEALKRRTAKLGANHPDTLNSMGNLARGYQAAKRLDLAVPLYEETLRLTKAKLGPDHPATLTGINNLAACYYAAWKHDQALPLFEEALRLQRATLGPDHPDTVTSMGNVASCYRALKKLDLAVPLYEEALKLSRAKLGSDHPDTLLAMHNLALAYQDDGKPDLALPLFQEAAAGVESRQFVYEHAFRIIRNLIRCHERLQQFDQAVVWRRKWLAIVKARAGPESTDYNVELAFLGNSLLEHKKFVDAELVLRECLAFRQRNWHDSWSTFNAQSLVGAALLGQKKYTEAEPLLLQGYEGMKQREATIPPQVKDQRLREALERLVQLYDAWDMKDKADELRRQLEARKMKESESDMKSRPH